MNLPNSSGGLPDRLFVLTWLGVCGLIIYKMWLLEVPFAYEPMGPRPFPLILAGLMGICCIALLINPDRDIHWPMSDRSIKGVLVIGVLLGYSLLFEFLGFPLATLLMVTFVCRLYGGSWRAGLLTGLAIGILGFLFFDSVLQVTLPLGLFRHG